MRHLIFGTAGHVDHGKTALVRALTNIDCDTHPEEKRRGITINLGFAHGDFENGRISFIDVPGHKDFVSTMTAGASGIDYVILVIAADEGVMPQTREHLQILDLLDVQGGIIALTRTDLTDDEIVEAAIAEACELTSGTCLCDCPIIPVSSFTGEGIPELRSALNNMLLEAPRKRTGHIFRMYIDRIFTVAGHGTVMAGSVLGGEVKRGQIVYLLPTETELRIRRIETHGVEVDTAVAGDRASMNVVGMNRDDFRQGMMLSDSKLTPTSMMDAIIRYSSERSSLGIRSQALMLLGTLHTDVSLHLLDSDRLSHGQSGIVQLHLRTPCCAFAGDRFILRNTSGDATLGGGVIIDAHPLHHRRRRASLIQDLRRIVDGGLPERISMEVRKSLVPVSCAEIAHTFGIPINTISDCIEHALPPEITALNTSDGTFLLRADAPANLENHVLRRLRLFHKRNPLEDGGKSSEELMSVFGAYRRPSHEAVLRTILEDCAARGLLKRVRNTWALASHHVQLTEQDKAEINLVERFHRRETLNTPLMSELLAVAKREGISERRLHHLLFFLSTRNVLIKIDGHYLHHSIVDYCRYELLNYLEQHDEGVSVAGFRDLLCGNRKICLLLLARFDSEQIIVRRGDLRFITELGRETLAALRGNCSETVTSASAKTVRAHTEKKQEVHAR